MTQLDPRRFFSSAQRQVLYERAEGRCQLCIQPLEESWHADHRIPWADGGPTETENGQALCEGCNIEKGRAMQYRDDFDPRPFQAAVINQVLDRVRAKQDRTVVLASPGSGKTLAYQSLATRLIREGVIDYVAVFAPRTALAQQCETGWMVTEKDAEGKVVVSGMCTLFDPTKRLGKIRHRINEVPLTFPYELGTGFISTYQALAVSERTFLNWAQQHEGRFLLIADEAQFCGDSQDTEGGGTKAGELIKKMHEFALHTLLLTGTPYRADHQPLILADYEPDPDNPKKLKLVHHAEASYADGIAEGYLRTFELLFKDARVSKRTLGDPSTGAGDSLLEYNLSDNGKDLSPVLRDEKTWKPLVDLVVAAVRDKQRFNPAYRGLISCMQQDEATKVQRYLQQQHPDLRVAMAVSKDPAAAAQALADFKVKPMDILVTVRMAFIGYDCPQITVVGVLTNYRHGGHLMQLVGRGLRVWKDMPARQQQCVIVAPDDPKMMEFLRLLRDEDEQGRRILGERDDTEPGDKPVQEALSYVESAIATTTRAASNEVDMDADEVFMVEHIKRAVDSAETVTKLKQAIELAGIMLKVPAAVPVQRVDVAPPPVAEAPKTERQQIEEIRSKTSEAIKQFLTRNSLTPQSPGYQDAMTNATAAVNRASGYNASEANTLDKANKRLRAALKL